MIAGHHQRPKVPLVTEVVERDRLVFFPLVRRSGRSTDRSHLHVPLVVPSSSSDDDLSLVKHDAWVDLNPGGVRILYTQESAFMSDLPPPSLPPYIVSGQWVGVGRDKVLIPNPEYKGKGRTESASSNPTLRVQ
jgi:hypothetical protein